MNFKNLILSTILLLNIPTILAFEDLQFPDTEHEVYLNSRKIPIYSVCSKHARTIDAQTIQLIKAVHNFNLPDVTAALAAGANPDVNYFEGYDGMDGGRSRYAYTPALIMAINNQQWDIAETLILAGADVNLRSWKNKTGSSVVLNSNYLELKHTPLTKLIANYSTKPELERAQLNLVELLLKHGANIDIPAVFIDRTQGGSGIKFAKVRTALQLAIEYKHAKIAVLLQAHIAKSTPKENDISISRDEALFGVGNLAIAGLSSVIAYKALAKISQLSKQPDSLGNFGQTLGYGCIACCAASFTYISTFGLYALVEHKIQKARGKKSFVDQSTQGLVYKHRASMPNHNRINSNRERLNA